MLKDNGPTHDHDAVIATSVDTCLRYHNGHPDEKPVIKNGKSFFFFRTHLPSEHVASDTFSRVRVPSRLYGSVGTFEVIPKLQSAESLCSQKSGHCVSLSVM